MVLILLKQLILLLIDNTLIQYVELFFAKNIALLKKVVMCIIIYLVIYFNSLKYPRIIFLNNNKITKFVNIPMY